MATFAQISSCAQNATCVPSSPPGLDKCDSVIFRPPPGLERSHLQSQAFQAYNADQDPLWSAYHEYLQHRRNCNQYEQNDHLHSAIGGGMTPPPGLVAPHPGLELLKGEIANLFAQSTSPLKPQGVFQQAAVHCSALSAPLKPPGVFEKAGGLPRVASGHSLASTADTIVDEKCQVHQMCEMAQLAMPPAMAPGADDLATSAKSIRELRVEHLSSGLLKVDWPVDAKKLKAKDKQIVSPSFEIFPGSSFKLMLKPKPMGDKKGQASFHKAHGWGSVELKMMDAMDSAPKLRFQVAIGGGAPRGPVEHDFHNSTVGGLCKQEEMFNFAAAVDADTSTFHVSLDVALDSKHDF